ncbi:response regulator [Inhella sp.]|uniref:response regulator transcription factor n=1 Tax=Inhella sp. TaxID=1921806 RepID=UPI0035B3129E
MNALPLRTALVEDDPAFRSALASAVMQSPGLQFVGAAADLPEGLRLMERERPQLLLVDLQLPSGHGRELIAAASRLLPAAEVVVVSTLGDDESVFGALAAGASGYLLKQGSAVQLVEQLRSLREGGSPLSPVLARRLIRTLSVLPSSPTAEDCLLSEQESAVLQGAALGYRYEEIASQLGVTAHTVATYVKRCYRKLQVHSKAQAIARGRQLGLIP